MTKDQALIAADIIDKNYLEPNCSQVKRTALGKELSHLRWMVQEMHNGMSNNKSMRWLGYIQGILVGVYDVSLESMKDLSRVASES
jgi:hypothetical protein